MHKPGQFCWVELATTNLNQAKDFYHKVFGWEFRDVKMDNTIHTIATSNELDIAGVWQIPQEMNGKARPHLMSYILVEDIDVSLQSALEHGAKLIREVVQVGDRGKYAVITDPAGAHLALWETIGDDR
jgi:predicted enzyme related to lactoylglutathione lyase